MGEGHDEGLDGGPDLTRRSFVTKFLAAAFVTPVIVSFGLDAVSNTAQAMPNQTCGNQRCHDRDEDDDDDEKEKEGRKKKPPPGG